MIGRSAVTVLMVIAVLASIISLYFYMQYYQVEETRGYVYGMIPLIMDEVCMIVFLITCVVGG